MATIYLCHRLVGTTKAALLSAQSVLLFKRPRTDIESVKFTIESYGLCDIFLNQ